MIVPSHFWLEFVNGLVGRHRWPANEVLEAIYDLDEAGFRPVPPIAATSCCRSTEHERFGLTAYDAAYLALTDSVDGELLTFDRALGDAAGNRAIHLGKRLSEPPAVYEHDVTWPKYKGASAYLAKLRAEALRPTTKG